MEGPVVEGGVTGRHGDGGAAAARGDRWERSEGRDTRGWDHQRRKRRTLGGDHREEDAAGEGSHALLSHDRSCDRG
jgi:hypothetical protein